eukprot:scaffold4783_cov373-Prasinococcus_capsulatus_cf.AAC.7
MAQSSPVVPHLVASPARGTGPSLGPLGASKSAPARLFLGERGGEPQRARQAGPFAGRQGRVCRSALVKAESRPEPSETEAGWGTERGAGGERGRWRAAGAGQRTATARCGTDARGLLRALVASALAALQPQATRAALAKRCELAVGLGVAWLGLVWFGLALSAGGPARCRRYYLRWARSPLARSLLHALVVATAASRARVRHGRPGVADGVARLRQCSLASTAQLKSGATTPVTAFDAPQPVC